MFINSDWEYIHIPVLAINLMEGHSAKHVGDDVLKHGILEDYDVDIETMVRFITSDTTASATNVSNEFEDATQINCEMHVLSLSALGIMVLV